MADQSDKVLSLMDVLVDRGPVATVTMNRPVRRNALTVEGAKEIAGALRDVADDGARAIILTGSGAAFCAGGDFDELVKLSEVSPEEAAGHLYAGFQGLIRAIREVEVPVIAAVNGAAVGAGMDVALACDMRIASSEAKLGQVWVKLGILPGTGGAFWTTMLAGPARAAKMILTGEIIDARTALEWGLVNEVVGPEELMPAALRLGEIIAENPQGAVAANKKALNEAIRPAYEAALEYAKKVQPSLFAGAEFKAALQARLNK